MDWENFLTELSMYFRTKRSDTDNIVYIFEDNIKIEKISKGYINVYSYVDISPDLLMEIMISLSEIQSKYDFEIWSVGVFYDYGGTTYWNQTAIDENEKHKASEAINLFDQTNLLINSEPEDLYQC